MGKCTLTWVVKTDGLDILEAEEISEVEDADENAMEEREKS